MFTAIELFDSASNNVSACTDTLQISLSSIKFEWQGFHIEKGWCRSFHPENVYCKNFIFVMAVENEFRWSTRYDDEIHSMATSPGEVWMNPPGIPFTHTLAEPCSYIVLTVTSDTLSKNAELSASFADLQFLKSYNISDKNIENMIYLFYNETLNNNANGQPYIDGLAKAFSVYFVQNYSNYRDIVNNTVSQKKIGQKELKIVNDFITNNIYSIVSIEELSSLCRISKYQFLKEFRKTMGITPYQYILKMKIEKSRELLMDDEVKIVDIACKMGFSDQSHFNRTFKRFFGYPPGTYKNKQTK